MASFNIGKASKYGNGTIASMPSKEYGNGAFYNCRECSSSATGTNRPIFLQNKANF